MPMPAYVTALPSMTWLMSISINFDFPFCVVNTSGGVCQVRIPYYATKYVKNGKVVE